MLVQDENKIKIKITNKFLMSYQDPEIKVRQAPLCLVVGLTPVLVCVLMVLQYFPARFLK